MNKRGRVNTLILAGVILSGCVLAEEVAQVENPPKKASNSAKQAAKPTTPVATNPATHVAKPTKSIPTEGCVTNECHPGIKAQPFTHGPVGVNACDACHEEADAGRHTFKLPREKKELCTFCHQIDTEGVAVVHKPLAEGECSECHDPHGGKDRFLLKGGPGAAACAACHDDVTEGMPEVHGPVGAGACTACHHPHSSPHPKLLRQPGRELCLECHLTLKKRLDSLRTIHGPVAVDCTACHLPHAAEHKMLLTEDTSDLCLECHSEIEDIIETSDTKHEAVSTGEACRNCHDPHGSDYAAMLINDMVEVCLSCHDKEIKRADGTSLMNMKAVLASGKSLHGPIAQHNCVACHQIHGGSNFRLLFKEYPPEFYAPFQEEKYALCFECHNQMLVHDEKTTSLTDFRNGDTNLHYLHVNKKTKGRTCRACHETHASNKAKHIRDSVPFGTGGWKLPIGFEKGETGGKCSPGCHRPYAYDRVNPVKNEPPEKRPIWPDATTPPPDNKKKGGKP